MNDVGEMLLETNSILDVHWGKKESKIVKQKLVKRKKLPLEDAT